MILLIDFGSSKAPLIEDVLRKFSAVERIGYFDFDEKTLNKYSASCFVRCSNFALTN